MSAEIRRGYQNVVNSFAGKLREVNGKYVKPQSWPLVKILRR